MKHWKRWRQGQGELIGKGPQIDYRQPPKLILHHGQLVNSKTGQTYEVDQAKELVSLGFLSISCLAVAKLLGVLK